jgi:hypothetical protein
MKKETLESFIKRYNLGNLIPKVKWKYTAGVKTLHCRAAADNRSFVADVVMSEFSDFGPDDLVVCIGDTEKVQAMMKPFGEDINLSVNKNGDRILGFTISDSDCESYCTAADPSAIDPVAKNLQDVPEYHVVVPLSEEFLEKFLAARGALKDVETFSVGMNKKGVFEFVIGYTTANSNRIRIAPATLPDKNKVDTALSFPIKNLAEVFKANSDITDGQLSINSNGILRAYFKNDKYACTYYQFANKKA